MVLIRSLYARGRTRKEGGRCLSGCMPKSVKKSLESKLVETMLMDFFPNAKALVGNVDKSAVRTVIGYQGVSSDLDEILLIRSKRYITGRLEWEIPAGRMESGETAEVAAVIIRIQATVWRTGKCMFLLPE